MKDLYSGGRVKVNRFMIIILTGVVLGVSRIDVP
jgi:hypothetical protein